MFIAEFLRARIAEDVLKIEAFCEDMARAKNGEYGGSALQHLTAGWGALETVGLPPRRVLAECGAKRAIVREWEAAEAAASFPRATALKPAVLALAAVYADHPDYQQEWKPVSAF